MTAHDGEDMEQREDSSIGSETDTMEISSVVSHQVENRSTLLSNYTTLGHIPKRHSILPPRHCSTMFTKALLIMIKNWKQPRCLSTEE